MAKTPYSELKKKIDEAKKHVAVGQKYYHWKHPESHYIIIEIALTEWNEEVAIVYKNVDSGAIWIRPLEGKDGWLEPVERDGEDKRRFIPVTDK